MKTMITAGVVALSLGAASASAATVGTLTFDDDAWADGVNLVSGVGTGTPAAAGDGDTSTIFNLRNDVEGRAVIEILFSDNLLVNGPGDDLVVFSGANNNALKVTINGVDDFTGTLPFEVVEVGGVGNDSASRFASFVFDLDKFGVAADATLSGGVVLSMAGVFGDVFDVAALNSTSLPSGPAVIPLPPAAALLLTGLAGIAALRRRAA